MDGLGQGAVLAVPGRLSRRQPTVCFFSRAVTLCRGIAHLPLKCNDSARTSWPTAFWILGGNRHVERTDRPPLRRRELGSVAAGGALHVGPRGGGPARWVGVLRRCLQL